MIIAHAHAILSPPAQDHLSAMKAITTTEATDQTDLQNHQDSKHQGNKAQDLKLQGNKVRDLNHQGTSHHDLNLQGLKARDLILQEAVETQTLEVEVQVLAPRALHHDPVQETINKPTGIQE